MTRMYDGVMVQLIDLKLLKLSVSAISIKYLNQELTAQQPAQIIPSRTYFQTNHQTQRQNWLIGYQLIACIINFETNQSLAYHYPNMPRENNPNILLKTRKLPAKLDEPLPAPQRTLPLHLPLAKPPLLITSEPQFHPKTPLSEPPLQPAPKTGDWSPSDEVRLCQLHNQLGNRWSLISRTFAGKSDNCIKNHFFSRLRMSLRHLNKQLPAQSHTKPIKMHVLYKIMSTCEERFNPDSEYMSSFIEFSYELKNKLLGFLLEKANASVADIEKTIEDMHIFNKRFKMRADILKVPKASKIPKSKRSREMEAQMQESSLSLIDNFEGINMNEGEKVNGAPSHESLNSLQSILQESWRFSEVLQLKNDRVEIKMVETSDYLFNDEDGCKNGWPQLDEAFRGSLWSEPLV